MKIASLLAPLIVCLAWAELPAAEELWPGAEWESISAEEAGMDGARLEEARDYALTGEGSGMITRHGRMVLAWGDQAQRYDVKSSSKSFGSIALGLAIKDGKVGLNDLARQHHPAFGIPPEENASTGWLEEVTLFHLASQTAGFEKPGGYTKQLFRPGTQWDYSDSGPNWLAECLTLAYRRDMDEVMFERIFTPLGIRRADLVWRKNSYRPKDIEGIPRREFGSGISANVGAMARVGLMMLRKGRWKDAQLIPEDYVALSTQAIAAHASLPVHENSLQHHGPQSPAHYGLLWWNNADGTLAEAPRDTYWSWGLYDSMIVVIPSLDIVVARAGKSWARKVDGGHYDPLRPFLGPIVAACSAMKPGKDAAAMGEKKIKGIEWAPVETIQRAAKGSDNWPMTWADDDAIYTAYGDGNGFAPFVPEKLSMGLARITGSPEKYIAENIRAPTLETKGHGSSGRKASGILCVKGVLYLWARNAGNSQLAWSEDHGKTWTWAEWKFTASFGCPTFINYGRDYAGNTDGFAYVCSQDRDDAYSVADRFVLARVPVGLIREQAAYEYLAGFDSNHEPQWSADIGARAAMLKQAGRCYRAGVTYNAPLGRYLLAHAVPNRQSRDPKGKIDVRFTGGIAVYEASQPWGPWSMVFETDEWDTGPGDSSSFPTKWISGDGRTLHLVFSGDDSFSVRRAKLTLAP